MKFKKGDLVWFVNTRTVRQQCEHYADWGIVDYVDVYEYVVKIYSPNMEKYLHASKDEQRAMDKIYKDIMICSLRGVAFDDNQLNTLILRALNKHFFINERERNFDRDKHKYSTERVNEVYSTCSECKEKLKEILAEQDRIRNLSDKEYSYEEMEKWINIHRLTPKCATTVVKYIKDNKLENFELLIDTATQNITVKDYDDKCKCRLICGYEHYEIDLTLPQDKYYVSVIEYGDGYAKVHSSGWACDESIFNELAKQFSRTSHIRYGVTITDYTNSDYVLTHTLVNGAWSSHYVHKTLSCEFTIYKGKLTTSYIMLDRTIGINNFAGLYNLNSKSKKELTIEYAKNKLLKMVDSNICDMIIADLEEKRLNNELTK